MGLWNILGQSVAADVFFICAHHQWSLVARHTPGRHNVAADALSHNDLPLFFSQVPNAAHSPSAIPPVAAMVLACREVNWLSQDWTSLFYFILSRP